LIDTPLLPEAPSPTRLRHADVTRSLPTTPSPSEGDVVRQQALTSKPTRKEMRAYRKAIKKLRKEDPGRA